MKKIKFVALLTVGIVVAGVGLASAGVRALKSNPSTLVISGSDYSWTAAAEDKNEYEYGYFDYNGIVLPAVSGKTTAYPVARMNVLTGTITVPSGAALGLEDTGTGDPNDNYIEQYGTVCSADFAFAENRDGTGFNSQGGVDKWFQILPNSPARTVDVTITSVYFSAYSSLDIAIYWVFNCETAVEDEYGGVTGVSYTPPTLPTFTLTNVRWMLTTLAG